MQSDPVAEAEAEVVMDEPKLKEIVEWKSLAEVVTTDDWDQELRRGRATFIDSLNAGSWEITKGAEGQSGLILSTKRYLIDNIRISFMFQMTDPSEGGDDDGAGADGLTFAITPAQENDMSPGLGGSIGFLGIGGFAVELDTYNNAEDRDGNHVAIVKDQGSGVLNHLAISKPGLPRLNDGIARKVDVVIKKGLVTVLLDGEEIIAPYQIPDFQAFEGHLVFSSATGLYFNRHIVWDIFATVD
jgi:hypothetical protein